MFCGKCGNVIKPGSKFCTKCGKPIVSEKGVKQKIQSKQNVIEKSKIKKTRSKFSSSQEKNNKNSKNKKDIIKIICCIIAVSVIGIASILGLLMKKSNGFTKKKIESNESVLNLIVDDFYEYRENQKILPIDDEYNRIIFEDNSQKTRRGIGLTSNIEEIAKAYKDIPCMIFPLESIESEDEYFIIDDLSTYLKDNMVKEYEVFYILCIENGNRLDDQESILILRDHLIFDSDLPYAVDIYLLNLAYSDNSSEVIITNLKTPALAEPSMLEISTEGSYYSKDNENIFLTYSVKNVGEIIIDDVRLYYHLPANAYADFFDLGSLYPGSEESQALLISHSIYNEHDEGDIIIYTEGVDEYGNIHRSYGQSIYVIDD